MMPKPFYGAVAVLPEERVGCGRLPVSWTRSEQPFKSRSERDDWVEFMRAKGYDVCVCEEDCV